MDNELRAVTGTTATIGYECAFADSTKKTVTIGSYRTADLPTPADLKTNINTYNSGDKSATAPYILSAGGAQLSSISGCTITVTQRTVII